MAESSFIIKDVRIFTGEKIVDDGYVLVEDSKIKSFGSSAPSNVGSNVKIISKPGHTLLPGFIDAHNHADKANPKALPQALRFGVTTFMDMHNEIPNVAKLRQQSKENPADAADFKTCGISATIENGWPIPVVTAHDKSPETMAAIATWPKLKTAEDAAEYMKWNVEENQVDYIKLMHESGKAMGAQFSKPSVSLQAAVIAEAHKYGKVAVAHALCLEDHLEVLNAGVDGLTHTFFDQAPTKEVIEAYKKNNAWLNPTLAAIGSLTKEGQPIAEKFAHDPRTQDKVDEDGRENLCKCMDFGAPDSKWEYAIQSVIELKKNGIDIICGSDSAGPALGTAFGLSLHHELWIFVNKCGFTPEEALKSATIVTAKRFGYPDRGRIAEGLKADLVLVEGNPLEDIDHTLNLRGVWRDGVLATYYSGKI